MLKANINNGECKIEIVGNLKTICADTSMILAAINGRLAEIDPKLGHAFKVVFTKGFMDGVCFEEDREHMEHYLAEADRDCTKRNRTMQMMEDILDFLRKSEKTENDNDNETK